MLPFYRHHCDGIMILCVTAFGVHDAKASAAPDHPSIDHTTLPFAAPLASPSSSSIMPNSASRSSFSQDMLSTFFIHMKPACSQSLGLELTRHVLGEFLLVK